MNCWHLALALVIVASGCSTSRVTPVPRAAVQQVPVPQPDTASEPAVALKRICIIENTRVKNDFLEPYRSALLARGYEVEVFPKTPPSSQCPLTTRYVAYWSWDLVLYLQYAELRVYRDGKPAGRAEFRARSSRFIDTEATVKQLVDQLFPK
jgi:hypothetical protein